MASRVDQLPTGITRVQPHTRETLKTAAGLGACPNWVWRVRVRRRGTGEFDQLYSQDVKDTLQATLDHLQHIRSTAVQDLRRDAARKICGRFQDDKVAYLARRQTVSDYSQRVRNLTLWEEWFGARLGDDFKTSQITDELVELGLEGWKSETVERRPSWRRGRGVRVERRWASATLRTRALHLSNVFQVLYPDEPNPVLALKDRLPPKSPAVEKAQPMPVVMALLELMRTPTVVAEKKHPSFASVRAAVLGFAQITIQELWSIRDHRAFDLRGATLRIPAKRVLERYTTKNGHGVVNVVVETREARAVSLTAEAVEACRQYLEYPDQYNGGGKLTKFGYFALGSFRNVLRVGSQAAGLEYQVAPGDFGTERAPSADELRALLEAMRHTTVPYRPGDDRARSTRSFIRSCVLAHTGARVGELAMLEPADVRLQERVVMMPTEKHERYGGRMTRTVSRRRVPLNDYGVAALKMFIKYDLFDRLQDRTRVPDETMVRWYQELYYQVVSAARRLTDPYSGAPMDFTPHCFRHSFATALAPLIGGDAKTGAKIMGHSPQTFMRYVRANDETARSAVEQMGRGLPALGEPVSAPVKKSPLRIVVGGRRM